MDARIIREMELRGAQDHISYFGFSGTPKNKTLELIRTQGRGRKVPPVPRLFHETEHQRGLHA